MVRQAISLAAAGEIGRYELSVNKPTGETLTFDFSLYPIRDEQGEVIFIVPEGRDITMRKQAEDARRETEERFHALADNIAQLAWLTDADGSIFWYNRRWFEYTGTTLDQMQGWGWQAVHHPDEVDRVLEKYKRHIASGEPWEDTFPLRSTDGEYRWFLSRALPIRDAAGKIVRWSGTNTDIPIVLLEYQKNEVVLVIEDDGVGFDPDAGRDVTASGKGLGLIGMSERCLLVGGKLEIESRPGKGTTIFARVPARYAG